MEKSYETHLSTKIWDVTDWNDPHLNQDFFLQIITGESILVVEEQLKLHKFVRGNPVTAPLSILLRFLFFRFPCNVDLASTQHHINTLCQLCPFHQSQASKSY